MNKNEIYVPIANKKEAKRARIVLESLGEEISPEFNLGDSYKYDEDVHLSTGSDNRTWKVWYCKPLSNQKQATLKQLIELVMQSDGELKCDVDNMYAEESKTPLQKIAVKVENEKEFKALMKYHDSLGYVWRMGDKATNHSPEESFPLSIGIENGNRIMNYVGEFKEVERIPFADFAKEHKIKFPLLTSEDGFDLYDGDDYDRAYFYDNGDSIHTKWAQDKCYSLNKNHAVITNPESAKAFSTKESALKWIEEKNPKEIKIKLHCYRHLAIIDKDWVKLRIGTIDSNTTVYYKHEDIKSIYKAIEELNNAR